jgi:hypothetical protein
MCEHKACWPTPEEAATLIERGYGDRLVKEHFIGHGRLRHVLRGRDDEGRCTFLTADGLCELHDPGLKPLEGRLAHHTLTGTGVGTRVKEQICDMWFHSELPVARS